MNRRRYITLAGIAGLSGCLRLQNEGGDDTSTTAQDEEVPGTPNITEQESVDTATESSREKQTQTEDRTRTKGDDTIENPNGDWTQLMHDPANTGYAPQTKGPVDDPNIAWRSDTQSNADVGLVASGSRLFLGDWSDTIYALNAESGELAWTKNTGHSIAFHTPAVAQDVLIIGTHEGKVFGLNADSGSFLWQFTTDNAIWSSPTILNDTVFISSTDGSLYALSLSDGSEQWQFTPEKNREIGFLASPATDGNRAYIGSTELLPDAEPPEGYLFDPEIKGQLVDMDIAGHLYAVNISDGTEVWQFEADHMFVGSPSVKQGTVYVGNYDTQVYAVDAESGDTQWVQATDDVIAATPAISEDLVAIGSWDGTLYGFDANTGDRQWIFPTGDRLIGSPAIGDDIIYINGHDGYAYAVDQDGRERWRVETHTSGPGGPALTQGTVFLCGKGPDDPEGTVVALQE